MSKSVYSVILSDDLVSELDLVAYKNGVSRSTMIDKILSEYLTVETPTVRMENIFSRMERIIGEWSGLRFINQPNMSMASVKSALSYRYNPTVKYSVELLSGGDALGAIKISLRTQSAALVSLMEDFYKFFIYLEKKYLGERRYGYENYKFTRVLQNADMTAAETGEAIAYFVRCFNYLLNGYFQGLGDIENTKIMLEKKYAEEMVKNVMV